jgi:hypothetical protein
MEIEKYPFEERLVKADIISTPIISFLQIRIFIEIL